MAGAILGHHPSPWPSRLVVARVRAVVVELPQFGLPRVGRAAMHHALVVAPGRLVLVAQGGVV